MFLNKILLFFYFDICAYRYVKVDVNPVFILQKRVFMVEYSRLIVDGGQIRVDGLFLYFQVLSICKSRDNKVNICLIRL
jgi:hypothetical protein